MRQYRIIWSHMKLKEEAEASHKFLLPSFLLSVVLPAPTVSPLLTEPLDSQLLLPIVQWLNLLKSLSSMKIIHIAFSMFNAIFQI